MTELRAWRGATALVLLHLFLAGGFASAAGMHGCPQHHHHAPSPDALVSRAADGGVAPDGAARRVADAPDAAGREFAGAARGAHGPGQPAGPTCTCLGDCQAGAPSALHEPPLRSVPGSERLARVGPAADERVRPGPRPEYFLPYPLGPPRA